MIKFGTFFQYIPNFFTALHNVSDPDPHKEMPPGSGFAGTDADLDPDPGGTKAEEMYRYRFSR